MTNRIKYLLMGIVLGFLLAANAKSQEPNFSGAFSLFADTKAHRVGDIITIHVIEFSEGSHRTNSRTEKESKIGMKGSGTGTMKFLPVFGVETQNNVDFTGRGDTRRTGTLRAKMTARIKSIDDNGNYIIEGTREVEVNNDRMLMTVTGIVRPEDISSDNIVMSYQIANAKITYKGKGHADRSQKPGWITRIFNWLF